VLVAQEGERIFVAAAPFDLAGQREQQPRLADEVERDVGERDVLLDHRAVAAPLRQPLAEDQRGVGDAQQGVDVHAAISVGDGAHRVLTCG
jgi:hypothetical protein